MQLKLSTDYALRCIIYLASHQGPVSAEEIGRTAHITTNYTRSTLQKMKSAGLVASVQGISGGYTIAKNPRAITLYDVFAAEESSMVIFPRLAEEEKDDTSLWNRQLIHLELFYRRLQDRIDDSLKRTTVFDIMNSHSSDLPDGGYKEAAI
jgi:Rrf2 family protein